MIDWGFIIGLIVIAGLLIVPLVYFGRRFSKTIQKNDPGNQLSMHITPVGHVLVGWLICVWAALVIARRIAPESFLGSAVNTGGELLAALGVSLILWILIALGFEAFGFPVMKRSDSD